MDTWPSGFTYQKAVQNPRFAFVPRWLRETEAVRGAGSRDCLPKISAGNFACVFQMKHKNNQYHAVRCFTSEVKDQQRRYNLLNQHLKLITSPYLVKFEYIEDGIRIDGKGYPIVIMDWVEGCCLDTWIGKNLQNPELLQNLASKWYGLVAQLHGAGMAHGDFQHGNIMISNDSIKLVDYDDMFVPALTGEQSPEHGLPAYQHPDRRHTNYAYDYKIDNFSGMIIYMTLLALAYEPGLWQYNNHENLVLTEADYINPEQSLCFQRLLKNPDPRVVKLAETLKTCCHGKMGEVPYLLDVISGPQPKLPPIITTIQPPTTTTPIPTTLIQTQPTAPTTTKIAPPPPPKKEEPDYNACKPTGKPGKEPAGFAMNPNKTSCFIFIVDQSDTMSEPANENPSQTRAQALADVINRYIGDFITLKRQQKARLENCYLGMVGYGDKIKPLMPGDNGNVFLASMDEIERNCRHFDTRIRKTIDGSGAVVEEPVKFPIWLEPAGQGKVSMRKALLQTADIVKQWKNEHHDGNTPIIINLCMGIPTDGSIIEAANQVKSSVHNQVLLMNILLTEKPQYEIIFPDNTSRLPSNLAAVLFDISSIIPGKLTKSLPQSDFEVFPESRAFIYSAKLLTLILALKNFRY